MQVPIRKPGKYTHSAIDHNITESKYEELRAELTRLKNIALPAAAKEAARLAEHGDFSENAGYQVAKGKLRGINQHIIELEEMIKYAKIIKPQKNSDVVGMGSTVTFEQNGKHTTYKILGSAESNPSAGVISANSPIGAALLGHRVGDSVKIQIKDRINIYKILKIE
ncbi:MAG: GreA/GreB family elongation factor [Patescibacteria group bacterium]|jgi:transcription elongation factor GreA